MEAELLKAFELLFEMGQKNLEISSEILKLLSKNSEIEGPNLCEILSNIEIQLAAISAKLNITQQSMQPIAIVASGQEFMYQNEEEEPNEATNESLKLVADSIYSEDDIYEEEEGTHSWDS